MARPPLKWLVRLSFHHGSCYNMQACLVRVNATINYFRMSKNNKTGKFKQQEADDDDFDDMLAELRAADVTTAAATFRIPTVTTSSAIPSTSTASTSRSSSTSSATATAR
jgi:hypothetical protein